MTLPRHVEYGGLITCPSPFQSLATTLWGFWADADGRKLDELCARVFSEPSGGEVDYRALGSHVMITWGRIRHVIPETPPFDRRGSVVEDQVAVWIPVARVRDGEDEAVAESFAMFVPYIWLDNPMSLATGREVFGYPKTFGWPAFPADSGPLRLGLDAFGLNYGEGEQAARHPLLEVVQDDDDEGFADELEGVFDAARHAVGHLFDRSGDGEPVVPGLRLVRELASDLAQNEVAAVFLKQFRSVEDGLGACLQQITEARFKIEKLQARKLNGRYDLTVHPLASQPLEQELGLQSQRLRLAYTVEIDFLVGAGRVLWDSAWSRVP
jgi:hypothetical protein